MMIVLIKYFYLLFLYLVLLFKQKKLISYSINGKILKEFENNETIIKLVTEEFIDYFELSNKKKLDIPYFN